MNALLVALTLAAGSRVPGLKPMPVQQATAEWLAANGGEAPGFHWNLSGTVGEIDTPGVVWADGMPVKMKVVRVKGLPSGVRDEVLAGFLHAGLFIPEEQPQPPGQLQVTAVDPRFLIAYTAIISGVAPVVTVVMTETNVALGLQRSSAPPPALPVLPGARDVMSTRGESFERVVFQAPGDIAHVDSFYSDVLGKAGYRAAGAGTWEGPGARITLVAQPADGQTVAVAVQKTLAATAGTEKEESP